MTHANLTQASQRALSAWERWNQQGIVARAALLRPVLSQSVAAWLIDHALTVMEPRVSLPGPTGEANTLLWEGRGLVALCAETTPNDDTLIAQLTCALLTGNVVVTALDNPIVAAVEKALTDQGFSDVLITTHSSLEALAQLETVSLYALCAATQDGRALNHQLAMRDGCLAQLVVLNDNALATQLTEDYLWRFVTESTLTVNTTAVGGNASLLELGGREDI